MERELPDGPPGGDDAAAARLEKQAGTALLLAIVGLIVFQPLGVAGACYGWRINRELLRCGRLENRNATVAIIVGGLAGLSLLGSLVLIGGYALVQFCPPVKALVAAAQHGLPWGH